MIKYRPLVFGLHIKQALSLTGFGPACDRVLWSHGREENIDYERAKMGLTLPRSLTACFRKSVRSLWQLRDGLRRSLSVPLKSVSVFRTQQVLSSVRTYSPKFIDASDAYKDPPDDLLLLMICCVYPCVITRSSIDQIQHLKK
jgi:hypothetical protein